METLEMICLANSRKLNGRCVAGKRIDTLAWARPLSPLSKTGELTLRDVTYADWTEAKVLDILRIPYVKPAPKSYQPEDFEMGRGVWTKAGTFGAARLAELCDRPEDIWMLGEETDRIAEEFLMRNGIRSSLMLIRPEAGAMLLNENSYGKHRMKCVFRYNGRAYSFGVTDLTYEREYLGKPSGNYALPSPCYLCISLGEPYNGHCYKLVATILI